MKNSCTIIQELKEILNNYEMGLTSPFEFIHQLLAFTASKDFKEDGGTCEYRCNSMILGLHASLWIITPSFEITTPKI